ncbi:MAG: ribosome small subunit-dependent GTPase A [Bacillota bacterium]
MLNGVITKGIGGFYYVDTGHEVYECRARGKFRLDNITPMVGDRVEIEVNDATKQGYLINIKERKNSMVRPTIANVDQVIIVAAAKKPDINMLLLQKLLVYTEFLGLKIVVCINKIDLDEEKEYLKIANMLWKVPYEVILSSAKQNKGIDELREALKNKVSVFAGPSGAGKSTLLNLVQSGLSLKTGDLSKKIDRGTHTTRHAELIKLDFGGMVADTPGFTSLDLTIIDQDKLKSCFPEFEAFSVCRFSSCMHHKEPQCGVKDAAAKGEIHEERYKYYIAFLEELKNYRRY